MPLKAVQAISKAQNGIGAFILQCKRLDFHYCDWGGSSKGMKSFIKNNLAPFARQHPQIEMTVSPRPGRHPCIRGHYMNGRQKAICVRNLEHLEILKKAEILRNASGEKLKKLRKPVISENESVRGIWSGLHGEKIDIMDVARSKP